MIKRKNFPKLLAFVIAFACTAMMLVIFVGLWMFGWVKIYEDNLVMRAVETAMFIYATCFLGWYLLKTRW